MLAMAAVGGTGRGDGGKGEGGGGPRWSAMLRGDLCGGLKELWESSGKLYIYKNSRSTAIAAVMLILNIIGHCVTNSWH